MEALEIIDAQVHVWEANRPERPWIDAVFPSRHEPSSFMDGTTIVTGDDMVRMMDEIGVDAAILVSSSRYYGSDPSYALEVAAKHPSRFGVVVRVDPDRPDLDEFVGSWRTQPNAIGLRLAAMSDSAGARLGNGELDPVFTACERYGVPLAVAIVSSVPLLARPASQFPDLQLVVDHLGLGQWPLEMDPEPFARLEALLALARFPNVAVKLTGAPTLSREPFPYLDIWPHVNRLLDVFGPECVLWGTDCTRTEGRVSYAEGLRWLTESTELSAHERDLLLVGLGPARVRLAAGAAVVSVPEIIDAQVHVWEPDRPERPWTRTLAPFPPHEPASFFDGTSVVTGDDMLRMMDEVGVDAAILVSSTRHYGVDASYALEVAAKHPERFGVVGRVDADRPDLDDFVSSWRARPAALGLRLLAMSAADGARVGNGDFDPVFAACERHGVPLAVAAFDALPLIERPAGQFPDLQLVIDHLGLAQWPFEMGREPFAKLDSLLTLARFPNVAVKLTAAPTLSREPFPYLDLWPQVHRVLAAFGPERVLWGTDCTRTEGRLSYAEGVRWVTESSELSAYERELVLGASLRRVFGWSRRA